MDQLRIGTLGAAKINPAALINPSRKLPDVSVVNMSARDPARARKFAQRHGIERVHSTYDDVLSDPDVDTIYSPLPNGLHAHWTLAALAAGKHVLCEKPFTSNTAEAEEVATAASQSGLVVMEAFHWRYHPMAARLLEILQSGQLGELRHIEAWVCFPLPFPNNIRYRFELGGGATMDAGCYAIHMVRT